MNLFLFIIYSACLFYSFKAEDKDAIKEEKEFHVKGKHSHPSNTLLPKDHHSHHVTTNVCNMSLVSSVEDENLKYKNCICDEQNGDVDCNHLGLTELPKLISFPKYIQVVNFKGNKISTLEPETFFNGGNVTELDLSHNHIDFISKTAFKNFHRLVRLDLSHNHVWNVPKDVFADLINLKELYLNFNNLIFLNPGLFKNLAELRTLSLKSNPIRELTLRSFENLNKLDYLNLASTMLTELPPHTFVFTPQLRILHLADNIMTEVPSISLYPLEHLKILDLSRNPITTIHSKAFIGLETLVTLKLNNMSRLTRVEDYAFGDMTHLQELQCNNNFLLQEIAANAFVEESTNRKVPLPWLYLKHNGLRNIPGELLNWSDNKELHLIGNPFHCDCNVTWMLSLQLQNHFQRHIKCFSPPKFANVALSDLKDYELTCIVTEDWPGVVLISILVILFLLALILASSLLVWNLNCRKQRNAKFHKMDKTVMNDISIDYYGGDDFVAKWSHVTLWEFDSKQTHRVIPELSQKHIEVDELSSRIVRLAAQILSKSVAAGLNVLSTFGRLPPSATHTANFCSTVDDLFDSLNGPVLKSTTKPSLSAKMDQHFAMRIFLAFLFIHGVCKAQDVSSTTLEEKDVKDKITDTTVLSDVSSSISVADHSNPTTENPTPDVSTASTESASPSSTAKPVVPPLLNSICSISLKTSAENDKTDSKKCLCDGFHQHVDCSHLSIIELPREVSFPPDIKIAQFQGNKISNLNSDTFYSARGITEINLSFNQIDFVSINAFKAFKVLVRLDLSHNRIWNLPKGMFEGLGNLRYLDISFNNLANVFPGHFAKLSELRKLVMKNNPLQELEPKHFEHLTKLEELDLESTLLKVIPDRVFLFTPNLKFLKLASNQLNMVPTEALHVLDHLKTLDLSGNPIEVVHQEAFRGMRLLVTLYMDRMSHLTTIEDYAFGDLIHLEELHCSYNFRLSEIEPYAFVKRSTKQKVSLAQLFLRQNDLKKIPQTLLDWNQGLEMHLRDNPLNCDCHSAWMINTKLKNDFQSHAKCATPADLDGIALSQLKGPELSCGYELSDIVLIVCGVIMGLLLLVLIISFLFWRRNYRGYAKPHFYKVNKNVNDIDYTGGDDGF
ncbi:slit homolog 3 protein [Parasteatoda tepidariorum]